MKNSKNIITLLIVLALILNFIAVGYVGLNYGRHWDEYYIFIGIKNQINGLTLLPSEYYYNSIYFYLGDLVLLPKLIEFIPKIISEISISASAPRLADYYQSVTALKEALLQIIATPEFILNVRLVYLGVSSLTLVWVYKATKLLCPNDRLAPILAAAIMAGSWEFQYHTRWIAIDTIFVQFASLTIYLLIFSSTISDITKKLLVIALAAFTAGMALSTKITALFLFLPVLYAAIQSVDKIKFKLYAALFYSFIFFIAFAIFTPGAILDPIKFLSQIAFVRYSYAYAYSWMGISSYTYYTPTFIDHIYHAFYWMIFIFPSTNIGISTIFILFSVVGGYKLLKNNKKSYVYMVLFFIIYAGFVGSYHLLIIRNWLVLTPLIVILMGIGFSAIREQLQSKLFSRLLTAAVFACIIFNFFQQWRFAISITSMSTEKNINELIKYIKDKKINQFVISKKISMSEQFRTSGYRCVSLQAFHDNVPYFLVGEEHDQAKWMANQPDLIKHSIGSIAVNYNYYPTWLGSVEELRILEINSATADKIQINFNQYDKCIKN